MTEPVAGGAAGGWLAEFRQKHGRAPRMLHVGNVANNAYLNAKLLNQAGYDCDVLCYDYYHLMGCPEWEDADFDGHIANHFEPDWTTVDLMGFQRPRWFVQGPQHLCLDYLLAKRTGRLELADQLWRDLGYANRTVADGGRGRLKRVLAFLRRVASIVRTTIGKVYQRPDAHLLASSKLSEWAAARGRLAGLMAALASPFLHGGVWLIKLGARIARSKARWDPREEAARLQQRFRHEFPERRDQLTPGDCLPFIIAVPPWRRLAEHYDIVQGYATDVIYPLLTGKRPYIGFEHGTLRDFTLADNALSRLTSLGYEQADHVFITNGDCLAYARQIKVKTYTAMIHAVDDSRIRAIEGAYASCHAEFGARFVFLCPLRHDWKVKGTDLYIRALPLIIERIGRDFRVVMTRWGAQVDDSQRLAKDLGVDDFITWSEPLNRGKLVRLQKSVDIVFDQIALPHFGATAPQAIAAGVPVIMSYDPASTAWIIPEPAPILSAWSPEEIAAAVQVAVDPGWRADYETRARRWFDTYHSAEQMIARTTAAYGDVCRATGLV